ncbi:RagB/SusD family nutrient uptake outer membrane protein [Chitinophaga silvatica]|uniref:RagB/SusD family nutrient uptake outer membrane protein n=1 Tax=Chitinophaga silvatica TaxID=2282649 RepID=A0A3E1YEY7_9BACT|nr:RagB/SusD family nutrient uptake outer membrane protein [Chitinophaga silvatica]RFS25095.1 RagB/SusD family nutrient uptake outer membrane protein [Chitinophaga silvatica]
MKRTNAYISGLLLVATMATSCGKDFLKEDPSVGVSVDGAILNESNMVEALAGTYRILDNYYLFGRNTLVWGDLLGDNTYISASNSGRLLPYNNYTYVSNNAENLQQWSQSYFAILQANRVIATKLPESNNVNQFKAEAYTLRALLYLNLVNYYAKPATVFPDADGVPVVTVPTNIGGALIKPARAKVSEVYDQIISDLNTAFTIMPETSSTLHANNTNFITKYAIKALQARAYLYRGDYENAKSAALAVVEKGGYTLAATQAAFNSYWGSNVARADKLETIFEINNSTTANNGQEGIDWMYSRTNFGDVLVTDDTYALYAATDIRRNLIVQAPRGTNTVNYINKYQNTANADRDEVKLLRYAEVLLTLSESYYRLKDEGNARLYLNMVAQKRDPSLVAYTFTGDELFNAIITERRKELAFEGLRFFDLKRLNVDFTRQNMGAKAYTSFENVKKTDTHLQLPIPELETANNPNVSPNPGY